MNANTNPVILLLIVSCLFGNQGNTLNGKGNRIDESQNNVNCSERIDTTTYAFPIGSKFTLELIQTDSEHYKYYVSNFEEINYLLDYSETDSLFEKISKQGTIECFFAKGIDQNGPFKSVLLLRNNTKKTIYYEALISYQGHEGFSKTSVTPLYPNVRISELWNNHLSAIVIQNLSNK